MLRKPSAEHEADAAAYLYAKSLSTAGLIDSVWRDGDVVHATTHGPGYHQFCEARDYDADVHLICETPEIADAGNLPDVEMDHGPVYFNVKVRGVAEDYTGDGLPTHHCTKHGAVLKDDIPPHIRAIAEEAGIDLEGDDAED